MEGGKGKIHEHPNANTNGFAQNPQNGNKQGRPKKVHTRFLDNGFSKSEVREAFAAIAGMTMKQANEVLEEENLTMLERLTVQTFLQAIEKKDYRIAKEMVEMFADKATQRTEIKEEPWIPTELTFFTASDYIDKNDKDEMIEFLTENHKDEMIDFLKNNPD